MLKSLLARLQRRLFTRCEECGKGFCSHERPVWFGHEPARLWRGERGLYHEACWMEFKPRLLGSDQ